MSHCKIRVNKIIQNSYIIFYQKWIQNLQYDSINNII